MLGSFSCFYIEIPYSNFTFCGTLIPSFFEFSWKMSKFQENVHIPGLCFEWSLNVTQQSSVCLSEVGFPRTVRDTRNLPAASPRNSSPDHLTLIQQKN